ncbi:MAG TPA: sugar ABC transporter permease, partial [Trueperaceae bacterium]|nr:sugar ABC transporter permease [Trueperaceae bacterium]
MDISRPVADNLPRSRTTVGGLFKSLGLLFVALCLATAAGVATVVIARQVLSSAPAFIGIPIGVLVLVLILRWYSARFRWLMPWYYLLPSIIFLLTFTFFPVLLTIGLAFTDYAGIRNGELNGTTETDITAVAGNTITVASATTLDCADLRNGCNDVRAVVYASGEVELPGTNLDGTSLTLAEEPPAGRSVRTVSLFLPELGFNFEVRVVAQDGAQLTLERAPPMAADLESVTVHLDREPLLVKVDEERGDQLVLAEPLPEDREYLS